MLSNQDIRPMRGNLISSERILSVLIIEDETVLRENMAAYLEDSGYRVLQAENGVKGLEVFHSLRPDVVLTDLRMPVMDGKTVLAIIHDENPELPVIVVSGTGNISDAIDTIHLGAWDYVLKPIQDMAILEHAITKCVERADLIRLNREYREHLEEAKRIADRDMRMAINVQTNFFPKKVPRSENWDIAFVFQPMAGVSGDLYDFYEQDHELLGVSLFDVSGHGIASGLITMLAKSIMFRRFTRMKEYTLNEVMEAINGDLIEEIDAVDNYLTGILLRFRGDRVEYVNAAHPTLLCRQTSRGNVRRFDNLKDFRNGRFLGVKSLAGDYDMMSFRVQKGDCLLIYSDCLVESHNSREERFSVERLSDALLKAPDDRSAEEMLKSVLDEYRTFTDSSALSDDLTAILVKRIV